MPIRGSAFDEDLTALTLAERSWLGEPAPLWVDVHTHIGVNDPDGTTGTREELLAGLERARHDRALVFAMHEPGGYPEANDMVRGEVAVSPDRLDWLCRIDPKAPGAVAEVERCLALGAVGVKLHPRSDAFALPDPVVGEIVALVARRGGPVLFHAGRGIPNLGTAAAALARENPGARLILAHAGISDLGALRDDAAKLPNLLFDTAWWHVADLLALMTSVPPGQILYASDIPYGPGTFASFALVRTARAAGHAAGVVRAMAGEQARRVIAGEELLALGPAVGERALGPRSPALERVMGHTSSAVQIAYRGGDPTEPLALARLGCQVRGDDPHAGLLGVIDALLVRAVEHQAREGGDPRATGPATMVAHVLAGTPEAGTPDPALL